MKPGHEWNTTPKASTKPTTSDLHWAAGFLEGEGSFSSITSKINFVSAGQKERAPLDRLQALFGGNIFFRQRNNRPIYDWRISGSRARGVMMTLYSLMISPRRKARIADGPNYSKVKHGVQV